MNGFPEGVKVKALKVLAKDPPPLNTLESEEDVLKPSTVNENKEELERQFILNLAIEFVFTSIPPRPSEVLKVVVPKLEAKD